MLPGCQAPTRNRSTEDGYTGTSITEVVGINTVSETKKASLSNRE